MADLTGVQENGVKTDIELLDSVKRMEWMDSMNHERIPDSFEYRCDTGQMVGSSLYFSRDYNYGLCIYCLTPIYKKTGG